MAKGIAFLLLCSQMQMPVLPKAVPLAPLQGPFHYLCPPGNAFTSHNKDFLHSLQRVLLLFCIVAMPVKIGCKAYIFHKSFAKKVKPFVYRFKYLFSYIVIGNAYFLHSGNACGNSKYGLHF